MSTIYTVAKRAGVSTATVSRVMSQPDIVSPGTRHKVLQAVEDLGYTPNSAARHLRTLRSGKLLVTVPDISNPFFALILQGIEDAAHRDGYAVLLGDTQHDETREERYALMLRRKEADGLIFLGHRLPDAAQAFIRSIAPRCAPVVNSCEFSSRLGVPGVHIDNAKAASDGDRAPLSPRPSAHRHRDGPAGQPAQPRSAARRQDAREARRRGGRASKS